MPLLPEQSAIAPWKLIETIALVGLAIIGRGAAHLIDDHVSLVLRRVRRGGAGNRAGGLEPAGRKPERD